MLYVGHDPVHALGQNGQQKFPLVLFSLLNDAMVKSNDGFQKLIISAVLSHELIQSLQRFNDAFVVFDLL